MHDTVLQSQHGQTITEQILLRNLRFILPTISSITLIIILLGVYKTARISQERRTERSLIQASLLLEASLKSDRTKKLEDYARFGDLRPMNHVQEEHSDGSFSPFESRELADIENVYKESVTRIVELIDKKSTLESQIRDARWYKSDGWYQKIDDARHELAPLSIDLIRSLRDARSAGLDARKHLNEFYFPATEIDLGIIRYSSLTYSTE
ncbi:hypothetical protein GNZ24_31635 [Burkholderia thailandensis]|uniref:hypothetical protein n=1 Tax=Burkholderia thailandensis TaxID=57975 RepID=UPI0012E8AED9|nr:hypothetical protein [Burkholderia thailandensis]MUV29163.1 hypothetical protein [Burkholderia thailandensis]MUV31470.1 hypothetical protein [Burkholderia thailandensis]